MNALFGWPGGKRNLTKTLLERIPEHGLYVEVFAGSAKLLFAKEPSKAEVINDLNGDVINFYRVVKHRAAELAELLEHECVHPARFRELAGPAGEDELQRALRFVYRTWYSYGSMGKHFAAAHLVHLLRGQRRRPVDLVRELLLRGQQRLAGVRLEQRDCLEMLRRFDTPDTFFYLDPPYVAFGDNGLYEPLSAEVREALFAELAGLKGRWMLSFDDCAEVRGLAERHGMQVEQVETTYMLGSTRASRGKVAEVLITPRPRGARGRRG